MLKKFLLVFCKYNNFYEYLANKVDRNIERLYHWLICWIDGWLISHLEKSNITSDSKHSEEKENKKEREKKKERSSTAIMSLSIDCWGVL